MADVNQTEEKELEKPFVHLHVISQSGKYTHVYGRH